jgi:hypothetical protein
MMMMMMMIISPFGLLFRGWSSMYPHHSRMFWRDPVIDVLTRSNCAPPLGQEDAEASIVYYCMFVWAASAAVSPPTTVSAPCAAVMTPAAAEEASMVRFVFIVWLLVCLLVELYLDRRLSNDDGLCPLRRRHGPRRRRGGFDGVICIYSLVTSLLYSWAVPRPPSLQRRRSPPLGAAATWRVPPQRRPLPYIHVNM